MSMAGSITARDKSQFELSNTSDDSADTLLTLLFYSGSKKENRGSTLREFSLKLFHQSLTFVKHFEALQIPH